MDMGMKAGKWLCQQRKFPRSFLSRLLGLILLEMGWTVGTGFRLLLYTVILGCFLLLSTLEPVLTAMKGKNYLALVEMYIYGCNWSSLCLSIYHILVHLVIVEKLWFMIWVNGRVVCDTWLINFWYILGMWLLDVSFFWKLVHLFW